MRHTSFALDSLGDLKFEGYTRGETWNGFACPYFTREQAQKLADAWVAHGYTARYNGDADEFAFGPISPDDGADAASVRLDGPEAELYGAVKIDGQRYYPVGTFAWIWDEANP